MTITYTDPVPLPPVTSKRLVAFSAVIAERRIVCDFQEGVVPAGTFIGVGPITRRIFTDETVPSFSDFVAACPAAGSLRRQIEQYETTLSRPGSVD